MSTIWSGYSTQGLQQQLDALASFWEQCQLTVNLSKTKVVVYEARKSDCKEFVSVAQLWSNMMSTATLALCFMPPKRWHMASNN